MQRATCRFRHLGHIARSRSYSTSPRADWPTVLRTLRDNQKTIIQASLLLGGGGLVYAYWSDLTFIANSLQRSGRTLWTVGSISLDYKRHFPTPEDRETLGEEEWRQQRNHCHQRGATKLLQLFQKNGGIYIKLGQHLSALEYILPEEYCRTMNVLHSQAPTSSMADVAAVIKEDLGMEMHDVFSEFDPNPIGAASLAQVHRATLRNGQGEVAIKVQHRALRSHMDTDMFVVSVAVRMVKRLFREFNLDWLVDEMHINIPKEMDFLQEAHNSERVTKNFHQIGLLPMERFERDSSILAMGGCHRVRVPRVHWEFTSARILTMEYLPGAKVTDLAFMDAHGIDPKGVSSLITRVFSEMIFLHGFVHCDPHPGNLLIRLCGNTQASWSWWKRPKWELILLDHGLYREIPDEYRQSYAGLWKSIVDGDEAALRYYSQQVGGGDAYRLFGCILAQRSWKSITSRSLVQPRSTTEAAHLFAQAPNYLSQVTDLLGQVPRPLLLLLKTNDLLRHLERSLTCRYGEPSLTFLIMAHYCIDALYPPTTVPVLSLDTLRSLLAHWKIRFYAALINLQIYSIRLHRCIFRDVVIV